MNTPAMIILNRPDARTMPCQVCVSTTLVNEADAIHTPASRRSNERHFGDSHAGTMREREKPHVDGRILVAISLPTGRHQAAARRGSSRGAVRTWMRRNSPRAEPIGRSVPLP